MDEREARSRVARARVARLATMRDDGRPHIVPVCYALDGDTIVSVVDGKPKRSADLLRLANVRAHPAVTMLVDHYDDDWTQLWWVRVDGVAEVVVDGVEHEQAIAKLSTKYPQYRSPRPSGAVMQITLTGWTSWEAAAPGI
jgi:PPOX class probable F420-dependent enzyme